MKRPSRFTRVPMLAAAAACILLGSPHATAQIRFSPTPPPAPVAEAETPAPDATEATSLPTPDARRPIPDPRPPTPDSPSPILAVSPTMAAGGPTRIAFVDVELVIERSRALRRGLDAMDEQLAGRAREIDRREREFRRLRFDLDRQEGLLSAEERQQRRGELVDRQDEINRLRFDFESEMRTKERLLEPVLERIMNVVADVAERDRIDLVLRGEVVIFGSHAADLTGAVVAELDARGDEIVDLFRKGTASGDRETTATLAVDDGSTTRTLRLRPGSELPPLIP